ncbi:MAG: hypothetical protein ACFE92_17580 [Promethearchaeota archaeon]
MKRNTILWIFLIAVILVTFMFNQMLAIWITLALLGIALLVYLLSLQFKKKLIRIMQKYVRIIDTDISEELNQPIERIRKNLLNLYKNQKKRRGLIIFLNKRYIFYNNVSVSKFLELFNNGIKEKEILEQLKEKIGLRTRAEVKAIKDTLIYHKKIEKSKSIIELKDQIRKSEIY